MLGVSTASYLPSCFCNFASPILDVLYGFIGFKVPKAADVPAGDRDPEATPPLTTQP